MTVNLSDGDSRNMAVLFSAIRTSNAGTRSAPRGQVLRLNKGLPLKRSITTKRTPGRVI